MNVIIIEDEKPSARRLQRMLKSLGVEAETMLHSVEESSYFLVRRASIIENYSSIRSVHQK